MKTSFSCYRAPSQNTYVYISQSIAQRLFERQRSSKEDDAKYIIRFQWKLSTKSEENEIWKKGERVT